jgi:exodeoxyribonuclease-3
MKIATFNINDVNRRLANLLDWLRQARPDVASLQELKATDAGFPIAAIEKAGYGAVWRGQKSWNGVAILARDNKPVVTRTALPGDPDDTQSRYIEAAVNGVLVATLYAPNGNPQPGPKFKYKLAWMKRLLTHAAELYALSAPVVLAGDFNVVPTDADIYPTKSYAKNALVQPEPRTLFRRLLDQGWTDAIRAMHPDAPMYTFWDYKRNRWQRDAGLRIDHLLLNPKAAKRLVEAGVDREVRGLEGASDHAPAWIVLSDKGAARRKSVRHSKKQTRLEVRPSAGRAKPLPRPPLLVIDGDSFAHRSYHALPKKILRRGRRPAGAILGFANMLLRLYRDEQPRAVLVAWDTLEVLTYRHENFPAYQSGREFADALLEQLALVKENAPISGNGRLVLKKVFEARRSGFAGVNALHRLWQLHLVADQNDVPRGAGHCNEVAQRNLSGFIDNEVIKSLTLIVPAKIKDSSADEAMCGRYILGRMHRRDVRAVKFRLGIALVSLFDSGKG